MSGIFQPILGVMSACGMLKGFNALFLALGLYKDCSGVSILLNGIGDALFMFLPLFLGFTSAKKFNLKPMLGLAIGAAMCYPALQLSTLSKNAEPLYTLFANTIFASDVYINILGIPIISMDYTSTVIPVIFIVYFASKCEKFFNKIIPDLVKFFIVPMLVLLVSLPIGFLIIGPITMFGSMIISQVVFAIRNVSPLIAGTIVGGTWQILVIFGMHWGFIPVYINNVMTLGYDNVMMPFFACTFATSAVVLAIFFKTKNKKLKEMAIPNFISGIFGVTEPAIYGILLPLKKPFIISCIAGGIGGALGEGIAVMPEEGAVYAPVDGTISAFFQTGHAIGMTTENGVQLLIHVGMDTVQLEGKGFKPLAAAGDIVKKGQKLLEFDMDFIKKQGYSLVTPVLVANSSEFDQIICEEKNHVQQGETLLTVE